MLEMDILLRSSGEFQLNYSFTEVKGGYVDYRIRRITPFDVFNNVYGNYTGPMLSKLLKEKGSLHQGELLTPILLIEE